MLLCCLLNGFSVNGFSYTYAGPAKVGLAKYRRILRPAGQKPVRGVHSAPFISRAG